MIQKEWSVDNTDNNAKSCICNIITPTAVWVGATWRESSFAENCLQVLVDKKLNMIHQHALAMKMTSNILGCISRSMDSRPTELIILLCLALGRPHLEYCVLFLTLYYKNDIDILERV